MAKLQVSKNQATVTIPMEYVQACDWKKGDKLTVSLNDRGVQPIVELRKV